MAFGPATAAESHGTVATAYGLPHCLPGLRSGDAGVSVSGPASGPPPPPPAPACALQATGQPPARCVGAQSQCKAGRQATEPAPARPGCTLPLV